MLHPHFEIQSSRNSCRASAHRHALIVAVLLLCAGSATAAEFYIDPLNGSPGGDGSPGDPWLSIEQVVNDGLIETRNWESLPYADGKPLVTKNGGAPVTAGDTLWLATGYHGNLNIQGAYNSAPITIAAAPGANPRLGRVNIVSGSNWILRGLSISPAHAPPPKSLGTIVRLESHGYSGPAHDFLVEDCDIFTIDDASAWNENEWLNSTASGISVRAEHAILRNNRLRNLRHGISVSADHAVVAHNTIDGFSADGIRGLGDDALFEYNVIKNAYSGGAADTNHDDGFQSWSVGPGGVGTGEVRNVILRGNIIISNEDPNHPLATALQGIGLFDGFFVNWTVENNVIAVDHWHGISFYGARDSKIINNTVLDVNDQRPGPPWIRVGDHKNGSASENVIVRNNLATDFSVSGINVSNDANIEFRQQDAGDYFVAAPLDLHLLKTAPAVDAGSAQQAPLIDLDGTPRPQGAAFDVGAYEWFEPAIFADGFEDQAAPLCPAPPCG